MQVEDGDVTVGRRRQAEDHVDGRGLAGAVRPEEGQDLAAADREVDATDGLDVAEVLGHGAEGDRVHDIHGVAEPDPAPPTPVTKAS
ncbi:hypothetical protein [Phycicoccus sp. HDW14]|uniref:hypothetical protein n=1 Tax=Phycicoccus sp. HDW14 TaxID=2714941 RepID=UPI0035303292